MNYKIRQAGPNDIPEIIDLCMEHAQYENATYNPIGKAEKLANMLFGLNPKLNCLVVEKNNGLIGYATFSQECSTWAADYYTHMDCLYLKEHYRGFGIGEALVNEIILEAKAQKAHHIEWQTPIINERAIKFYSKIGANSKEKLRFTLLY